MRWYAVIATALTPLAAGATTESTSAAYALVGFTKDGKHAVARWHLDGGTTDCTGVTRMLLLSLADGRAVDTITTEAGADCGVGPAVPRSAGRRRWRAALRKAGGIVRGDQLKRASGGLAGRHGRIRIAIRAALAEPCARLGQRVGLTFSVFNGLVAFPRAWRGDVECGLRQQPRDHAKPHRIWTPEKLTAGRIDPRGAHALVLFGGRPFVVKLAPEQPKPPLRR